MLPTSHDLYTEQVLFEFNYDKNFKNLLTNEVDRITWEKARNKIRDIYDKRAIVHKPKFGNHSAIKTLNNFGIYTKK